ncbi:MAG: htpX [Acidimicrobiales bacterium]|nr:htpX [Acidimicrobiales bacterium]
MATNRFIKDSGLTARMTLVMFLLGALFVGLVVGMMYAVNSPGLAMLIGIGGIAVAFYQWWSSDKMPSRGSASPTWTCPTPSRPVARPTARWCA